MCICVYTYIYIYTYKFIYVCVYIYVYMPICTHENIYEGAVEKAVDRQNVWNESTARWHAVSAERAECGQGGRDCPCWLKRGRDPWVRGTWPLSMREVTPVQMPREESRYGGRGCSCFLKRDMTHEYAGRDSVQMNREECGYGGRDCSCWIRRGCDSWVCGTWLGFDDSHTVWVRGSWLLVLIEGGTWRICNSDQATHVECR